jgi:hypothetical protein
MGNRMLKARWKFLDDLVGGIRHYKDYLCMMKDMRHWVGDPPLGVHLAWHVHMMHPQRYQTFTTTYLGRLLEHHDEHEGGYADSNVKNDGINVNVFMCPGDHSSTFTTALPATVSFKTARIRRGFIIIIFSSNLASAVL